MIRKSLLPSPVVLTLLVASMVLAPSIARAQETVPPARQLFVDARKLMADGKYPEACPKLEESLRLEVGIGTQFNLADCWEHIGRTASAHALFLSAAASARAAGQSEREQVLRDRAAALEPRLSRLVIAVPHSAPMLVLERNDLPLEKDSWGKAEALDPGRYTIRARAPGKQTWQKVVELTAATSLATVHVPQLEPAPAPEPAMARTEGAPKVEALAKPVNTAAPAPSATDPERGSRPNYGALAVAGVSLGAIAVGTVMGIRYLEFNGDAKGICPSNRDCTPEQIRTHDGLVDDARTARAWSYAGFGLGALSLVGAGALWYLQKPRTTAGISWQAAPVVASGGCYGAALAGSF